MRSIRVFLVAVILAVITLFNFMAALRGYQSSMLEAERLFDKQLLETAKLVANIDTQNIAKSIDHDSSIAFQIWQQGAKQTASSNAPAEQIAAFEQGFGHNNFDGYRWRTVSYYDSVRERWVLAAERTDLRYALAENVILESIFPILLGLPIVGLLIWLIVGQGLRPLRNLANALGNKQPEDLGPLSIGTPKRELEQIVSSSNELLKRLETSLQREKQFASDAAHELRTPISALKVQLYNIAQDMPEDSHQISELTTTADRLGHIVEQILDLYRSSPDQYNATFTAVDLAALAQEVIAQEYPAFDAKNQQIEFAGASVFISGDRFALTTLLRNLLRNANKYTPSGGQIDVSVKRNPSGVVLTVEDSGPGIPEAQRQTVFQRFYRLDGDRHPSGESGCGLGLAIVKRIVELHHANISITSSHFETGAAFQVSFPVPTSELDH